MKVAFFLALCLANLVISETHTKAEESLDKLDIDHPSNAPPLNLEIQHTSKLLRNGRRSNRYDRLTCNHELKRSYVNIPFDYLFIKPLKSTDATKDVCYNMPRSCCSDNELKTISWIFDSYLADIKYYFLLSSKIFVRLSRLDPKDFWFNFKYLLKTERGKCMNEGLPPDYKNTIMSLAHLGNKYLEKNYKLFSSIRRFYSGFLCTLCNPSDHAKIRLVDAPNIKEQTMMRMEIDVAMCNGIFEMKQLHYDITGFILKLQKLMAPMLCLYTEMTLDQDLFDRMEAELIKEKAANERCLIRENADVDLIKDPECTKRCLDKFHFQNYINSNNFLVLGAIIRRIFYNIEKMKLRIPDERYKSMLQFIEQSNNEHFYRRIYEVWPPVMGSPYTYKNFLKVLTFDGLNFFDNRVVFKLSEEESQTHFMQLAKEGSETTMDFRTIMEWSGIGTTVWLAVVVGLLF